MDSKDVFSKSTNNDACPPVQIINHYREMFHSLATMSVQRIEGMVPKKSNKSNKSACLGWNAPPKSAQAEKSNQRQAQTMVPKKSNKSNKFRVECTTKVGTSRKVGTEAGSDHCS